MCDFSGRLSWFVFERCDFLGGNGKVITIIMSFDRVAMAGREG
jgi:hypothetical protein